MKNLLGWGLASLILITLVLAIITVVSMLGLGDLFSERSSSSNSPPIIIEPEAAQTCEGPFLMLETRKFAVRQVESGRDIPPGDAETGGDTVYWLSEFMPAYVFALKDESANIDFARSLNAGEIASIAWPSCEMETFTLSAPEFGAEPSLDSPETLEYTFILFLSGENTEENFLLKGSAMEIQQVSTDIPASQGSAVEAEISLNEVRLSGDQSEIQVSLTIFNYGAAALTLTHEDVRLIAENQPGVPPEKIKPSLPEKVRAGASRDFMLTFSSPGEGAWLLRVFTSEFDLADYMETFQ